MTLSIGERRAVTRKAAADFDFRTLLKTSPHAAIERITGRTVTGPIDVIEEAEDWRFVVVDPATIERNLPEPGDGRAMLENYAYHVMREHPELIPEASQAPAEFAKTWFDYDLPQGQGLIVHSEAPGTLVLIVPNPDTIDILDDNMLDLISGGSTPNCNPPAGMAAKDAHRT